MLLMLLVEEVESASTAYDLYAGGAIFISQLSQHSKLCSRGVQLDRLRDSHFKEQLTQYPWVNQMKYLSWIDISLLRFNQLKQVIFSS